MPRFFLMTTALVLLGYTAALGQVDAASSTTALTTPTPAGAAISMPPAGNPGGALGAIGHNLAAPIASNGLGTITACPTTSTGGVALNFPVDSTDLTTSGADQFGTLAMAGTCNTPLPTPSPGVVPESVFSDGADPLSATEAGGGGLSPLIAVPVPVSPSGSCNGDLTMPSPFGC
jgi:hypothetical protein